jgi:hypothetical protein
LRSKVGSLLIYRHIDQISFLDPLRVLLIISFDAPAKFAQLSTSSGAQISSRNQGTSGELELNAESYRSEKNS